jgi:hypothetical protein
MLKKGGRVGELQKKKNQKVNQEGRGLSLSFVPTNKEYSVWLNKKSCRQGSKTRTLAGPISVSAERRKAAKEGRRKKGARRYHVGRKIEHPRFFLFLHLLII